MLQRNISFEKDSLAYGNERENESVFRPCSRNKGFDVSAEIPPKSLLNALKNIFPRIWINEKTVKNHFGHKRKKKEKAYLPPLRDATYTFK